MESKDDYKAMESALRGYVENGRPKADDGIKGQVRRLLPLIETGFERGFTQKELFDFLKRKGLDCSFSSFKAYLAAARETGREPRKSRVFKQARTRKKQAEAKGVSKSREHRLSDRQVDEGTQSTLGF